MHSLLRALLPSTLLLFTLILNTQQCDFTFGYTSTPDVLAHIAAQEDYFANAGLPQVCSVHFSASDEAFDALSQGTIDSLLSSFDEIYATRLPFGPDDYFSVAAGHELATGYSILANENVTGLDDLNFLTLAVQDSETGLTPLALEVARIHGMNLSTDLSVVSGLNDWERNALVSGQPVGNFSSAHWTIQSGVWGLSSYCEDYWSTLVTLGKLTDFIHPLQGGVYITHASGQNSTDGTQTLSKFFEGLLRAYKFAKKRSNKQSVIQSLREVYGVKRRVAKELYGLYVKDIPDLTGFNPFLVPSKRGMFNNAYIRYNQGNGIAPGLCNFTPGSGKLVDLRALDLAFIRIGMGSAFDCYDDLKMCL